MGQNGITVMFLDTGYAILNYFKSLYVIEHYN